MQARVPSLVAGLQSGLARAVKQAARRPSQHQQQAQVEKDRDNEREKDVEKDKEKEGARLERRSAALFRRAEPATLTVSMSTEPRQTSRAAAELPARPGRGLLKLRGVSSKSDSDSGFDGDSMVGEIKIKQVMSRVYS